MKDGRKKKAQEAAMRAIPMQGEGEVYRQRLGDFEKGYMAGSAAVVRYAGKNNPWTKYQKRIELLEALLGYAVTSERTGFTKPADWLGRAEAALGHQPAYSESAREIVAKTMAYLQSPEGRERLRKSHEETKALVEVFKKARDVPWEKLHEPFTI